MIVRLWGLLLSFFMMVDFLEGLGILVLYLWFLVLKVSWIIFEFEVFVVWILVFVVLKGLILNEIFFFLWELF